MMLYPRPAVVGATDRAWAIPFASPGTQLDDDESAAAPLAAMARAATVTTPAAAAVSAVRRKPCHRPRSVSPIPPPERETSRPVAPARDACRRRAAPAPGTAGRGLPYAISLRPGRVPSAPRPRTVPLRRPSVPRPPTRRKPTVPIARLDRAQKIELLAGIP